MKERRFKMTKILSHENGMVIWKEVDLELDPGIDFLVPRDDYEGVFRCDCCRRHINQLKPFGKAGDPLNEDLDGVLLVKTFRSYEQPMDEESKIIREYLRTCSSKSEEDSAIAEKTREKLVKKYGEDGAEQVLMTYQLCFPPIKSWECRDCMCLSDKQYHIMHRNIYLGEP
jgi:hypothetical protein